MPSPDHGFDPSDVEVRRQFLEVIAYDTGALAALTEDLGGDIDSIMLRCLAAELVATSMRLWELDQILGTTDVTPGPEERLRLVPTAGAPE